MTLRIGFLCAQNPLDRNNLSGTPYYMLQALTSLPDVEVRLMPNWRPIRRGWLGKVQRRLRARSEARGISREDLDDAGLDVILAPMASALIARFGASLCAPVVMVTDATPGFLRAFCSAYDGSLGSDDAQRTEAAAVAVATHVVYSSDRMAEQARAEFDLAPGRVSVIPFGVNLDVLPAHLPQKPPLDRLNLLFIGLDWQRKGGDVAVDALAALQAQGVAAGLTLVGSGAPEARGRPGVTSLGHIDKNDPAQAARLTEALTQAHVFVLPTRADCAPMVVAEANIYGCPVVISDLGGIPTLMRPGINGAMLPPDADGAAYAAAIRAMTADPEAYRRFSQTSFDHCHARLTWEAWGRDMHALLLSLVGTPRRA